MTFNSSLLLRYGKAWWQALRLFSLPIAWISCLLGVVLAFKDGFRDYFHAVLILIGGSLLQAGVNLVNDFFEFKQHKQEDKIPHLRIFGSDREWLEWFIFFSGLACFALTVPLGLYLVYKTGLPLLVIGSTGFIGGYFYTGEPFKYKDKGLGVVFVFFLMGVIMIAGSYYAMSSRLPVSVLWISIPVSTLVSHILLCNEIRDVETDRRHGMKTLSVRIGYHRAMLLYFILLVVAYTSCLLLFFTGLMPHPWLIFLALPFLIIPTRILFRPEGERRHVIPWIMVHHSVFGLLFLLTYILTIPEVT